jgi:hypothetical protein
MFGVRNAFKRVVDTWYENSILSQPTWESVSEQVSQRNAGDGCPINLDNSSIDNQISSWESQYSDYLRKVKKFNEVHLLWEQSLDHSTDEPKRPRDVPSVLARLSTASGNSMQIMDALLYWLELPQHIDFPSSISVLLSGKLTYIPMEKNDPRARLPSPLVESLRVGKLVPDIRSQVLLKQLLQAYVAFFYMYIVGKAESYLKLKLAILEAKSKHQTEMPVVTEPFRPRAMLSKHLFAGLTGLELGEWICRDLPRCQAFVSNMKRAAAKASDEMLEAEALKSLKVLSTPQVQKPFIIPSGPYAGQEYTLKSAEEGVRRLVREEFSGEKFDVIRNYENSSTHGHYDGGLMSHPRAYGGARGFLHRFQAHEDECLLALENIIPCVDDFFLGNYEKKEKERPVWSRQRVISHVQALTETGCKLRDFFDVDEESIHIRRLGHWYSNGIMRLQALNAMLLTPLAESDERLPARIVTLAEPCKIRTVTCGPTGDYYWAMQLQKWMHGVLRKKKTFTLIGGTYEGLPISVSNLNARFRRVLNEGEFYVSGDYQAATNLISSTLSEAVADEISRVCNLPDHLSDLLLRSLTRHTLTVGEESVDQANGQLMGSPSSFPVLCLINAALTRDSQEIAGTIPQGTRLDDFEILVNGDDVAFPTTTAGYEIWKKVTACGGLNPSIGKNFTSSDFLVMNSCLFETNGVEHFSPVPRFNPCLECGQHHVTVEYDFPPPLQKFRSEHWFNMDYLGPCRNAYQRCRPWKGIRELSDLRSQRLQDLAEYFPLLNKKSRHHGTLLNLGDLFLEENYQILPSLQQKWLGDSTGLLRDQMNKLFLSSWKDVLDLTNNSKPDPLSSSLQGQVPFCIDWFLPVSLGGLGLENTSVGSRKGIKASSNFARQLAKYLLLHPDENLPSLPCLGTSPKFSMEVGRRVRRLITDLVSEEDFIPRHQPIPAGWIGEQDLVSSLTMETLFSAQGNVHLGEGMYRQGGDFTNNIDRTVALNIGLEKVFRSRARFMVGPVRREIQKLPPLTQLELDSYTPLQRIFEVEPPIRLKTFVGCPEKAPFLRITKDLMEKTWSSDRSLPSGNLFPKMKRYPPSFVRDVRDFVPSDPLPFSWPQYEPTTHDEWKIHALYAYRKHTAAKEAEEKKIGATARSIGADLFGDSEFDSMSLQLLFL